VTSIAFHFNVGDTVAYTCRLARKAVASGAKLVILVETEEQKVLDRHLWRLSAVDFLPHCATGAAERVVARSPIFLTTTLADAPHEDVLVNLCAQVPDRFSAFARVIEVVGLDDPSRQAARQRWRHYASAGVNLVRHDAQGGA